MAKKPKKHRKEWTTADVNTLKKLATGNTPTRVAAFKLGRTPAAVQQKAALLGISLKPTNQRPYNRRKK